MIGPMSPKLQLHPSDLMLDMSSLKPLRLPSQAHRGGPSSSCPGADRLSLLDHDHVLRSSSSQNGRPRDWLDGLP